MSLELAARRTTWRANRDLVIIGAAAVCFVASALVLHWVTGAPFTWPSEGESRPIGMHYLVPFLVGIGGYAVLWGATRWLPNGRRRRFGVGEMLGDAYFLVLFVIVMYVHFHIKMWMAVLSPRLYDSTYLAIDHQLQWLIMPMRALRAALAQLVPGIDALYQFGFLLMFAISFWFHALGDRRYLRHYLTAVLLLEMLGAFAYLLVPAVGPFVHERGPNVLATEAQRVMLETFRAARAGGMAWIKARGGATVTSMPAAMPSLHVAGAMLMSYYAARARLWVTPLLVVLSVWIAIESVVTRWHYVVDLPAGLALAGLIILTTNRICRHRELLARRSATAPVPAEGVAFGMRAR
ncbi:MAG: phosphatase PAP2 family protein [Rhodospirillaceae bacterium]|nr:phosphatase PAP2 family protein [Rhodospirillaceae bacterium]